METPTVTLSPEQVHELLTNNWLDGLVYGLYCACRSDVMNVDDARAFLIDVRYIAADGETFVSVGKQALKKFNELLASQ